MLSPRIFHVIAGLGDGGAEAVLYRLVCEDGPRRHQIVSLTNEGKYGPLLERAGARVVCLNMPRGRLTRRGLWRLWRLFRDERPEIVQTWMYHADLVGGVMARLAGVHKICWGIHHTTLEPGSATRTTIWIARLNSRLSHWVPHTIVCCAERAREVHAALGYAANKMVVIPNGYDIALFRPNQEARKRLRLEWGIPEHTFVIGMVARFDPQKDHSNLLAALARLKEVGVSFVCVLAGNGLVQDNASISQQIKAHGLEKDIRLFGQRRDIPELMNVLDVHVLSSYSEAFPNVLAEAMACGTPCVTTDVGDAARIVGDTGWVVPPRNADALAEALREAWTQWWSPEWASRQEAARQRVVEHFSVEGMAAAYRVIWES